MKTEEAQEILQAIKNYLTAGNPVWHKEVVAEALDIAIEALTQDSTQDLISRSRAIDACLIGWNKGYEEILADIKALPSAEPKIKCIAQIRIDRDDMEDLINEKVNEIVDKMAEPKTGEWVRAHVGTIAEGYYCSRCGNNGYQTDLCHSCGARMKGGMK